MNKKIALASFTIIIIAISGMLLLKTKEQETQSTNNTLSVTEEVKKNEEKKIEQTETSAAETTQAKNSNVEKSVKNTVTLEDLKQYKGLNDKEKESLIKFSSMMRDQTLEDSKFSNLVEGLKSQNLKPRVMNDGNPHTGEMTVVRTDNTIPGTRYFHAQYFESENGEKFVQHMSFEIKPSSDSFETVKHSLAKTFDLEGKTPKYEKDGYVLWDRGDGMILWIKKLELEDMKNVPFNAYDPAKDIGTIRVATEQEIHDHAPHSHIENVFEEGDHEH